MKLRPRIALTAIALSVPLALVSIAVERKARVRATQEILIAHARARLEGSGARDCARHPERWARPELAGLPPPPPPFGGFGEPPPFPPPPPPLPPPNADGPPIQVFAYDEALNAKSPLFPAIPEHMRGRTATETVIGDRDGDADAVLLRGAGECTWVLARRPRPPFGKDTLSSLARDWTPPFLAMLLAIAFGLGPIVRRIRALAARVRTSARERYSTPISLPGDDEIAELAKAFDEAGTEVRAQIELQEKREQTLRDFLGNTTHDVMTPLTVLQGHLTRMRQEVEGGHAVPRETISAAIDEAHYMAALVHNLGVAARLEAGEPHLTRAEVDLGALVNRVVLRHAPIAKQHEIELAHTVPEERVLFEGDETFLEQAVSNVVYNAIRHNEPGGHVAVVLEMSVDRFELKVLDDGPGIEEGEMERVVQRSVRGEAARTRHPDGRGLGLAITRRVAELHDLALSFEPVEPRGLMVRLEGALPAREKVR
ncbi:MAG: sensor histidine kinase [Polyangiales bacterium]